MAGHPNSDYELLTEHLGYPPVSLLDDIINTVNVLGDQAIDAIEKLFLSLPPKNLGFSSRNLPPGITNPEDAHKLEIEAGTHQLETLLTANIDKNFDKFELYTMKNILTIPAREREFVRLQHYQGLDFSERGDDDDTPNVEGITALRRRLQASQRLHVKLEEEKAKNEALLKDLRAVLGVRKSPDGLKDEVDTSSTEGSLFGFLRNKAGLESSGSQSPITTTTQFTLSQLQALRQLSISLRTILPALSQASDEASTNRTWRSERSNYVEASSRKFLESSGGLELGAQGEIRDGEYQGEGRNLSKGEVEGLERVVAALGGAGQQQMESNPAEEDRMDES